MNNIESTILHKEIVLYNGRPFYIEETDTETILTSVEKSKYGRYSVLHFTKDEEKSNQVLDAVGRMLTRAIIRGDI